MVVAPGDTTRLAPVPSNEPPQLPLYHCQEAAVPRLPPVAVSVALPPAHRVAELLLIEVAGVEAILGLMVTLAQVVVLQEPTAFTK